MSDNTPGPNKLPIDLTTNISIGQQALWMRDEAGDFYPIDKNNPLIVDNHTLPLTAFGDMRMAELSPILQLTFEATVTNTEIGKQDISGSGAISLDKSMLKAATGITPGSSAEWKSNKHAKYRAGLGAVLRLTSMFTTGVAGTEQVMGLADETGTSESYNNGLAVGYDGATFGFIRWSNDVLTVIPQSAWDDPLDGSGPSGMTIDPTTLNVFYIQFQYLGAGAIYLWVELDSSGDMILVHTIDYTNAHYEPSVRNPNFHLIASAKNGATTSNVECLSASMAFFIEGKSKYTELQQPMFTTGKQEATTVTTKIAIFTIRNKSNYNSKVNYIDIVLENLQASIEADANNNLGEISVVKNATLGGTPSWSDINTTNSVVEIDSSATTVSGGTELMYVPLAGKNDKEILNLLNYEIILSPGETITVSGQSEASATIDAGLLWKELF